MRCPKCGSPYSQTVFTHKKNESFQDRIYRTRRCDECEHTFNTVETFCTDNIANNIANQQKNEQNLAAFKHKAMKTARELYYGQAVVDKIQEANSIERVNQILKGARSRI